jgi:hypothetical protein
MNHKREITLQRVTVYFLVAVLFAFAGSVMGVIALQAGRKYFHLNNVLTHSIFEKAGIEGPKIFEIDSPYKPVQIDWAERYPFGTENALPRPSLWKAAAAFANRLKNMVSRYAETHLLFRGKYIEAAVAIEKIFGLNFLKNTVSAASYAILDGDYFVNYTDYADMTNRAKFLADFDRFLQSRNIPLLYIQAPEKVCREDTIASNRDFANRNADNLLADLKRAGISVLDLREEIHRQGLVHHDMFLKTDNHWKPETGLWASQIIAQCLNASFGFDIDMSLYNPERYDYRLQDDNLGSIGRRATLAAANPEPIAFIFPKFATDLTLRIPSRSLDERGDFKVFYYKELWEYNMSKENDIYGKDYYHVYCYVGINPVMFVHNNQPQHAKKSILMISNSFNAVVTPFLALGVENTNVLVPGRFTGSIQSFIDQTLPDVVLVLYSQLPYLDFR